MLKIENFAKITLLEDRLLCFLKNWYIKNRYWKQTKTKKS